MRTALVILVAACGRLGFEERAATVSDVAIDEPPPAPALIANAGGNTTAVNAQTLDIAIQRTTPDHLLVVAFTTHDDAAVASITDDGGNTYASANVRASMSNTTSELWYATHSAAATTIHIAMDKTSSFDAFALELSGVRGVPVKTSQGCLQYPPTFVTAPITTTSVDELIVTATMFQFPIFVSAMDPPFVGLPPITGNDAGYLVAHEPGTYASTFQIESGDGMTAMTCASSASWTPTI